MNKNSLVRYRYRVQPSEMPMRVAAVKTINGVRSMKVNGAWVPERALMTNKEWLAQKSR